MVRGGASPRDDRVQLQAESGCAAPDPQGSAGIARHQCGEGPYPPRRRRQGAFQVPQHRIWQAQILDRDHVLSRVDCGPRRYRRSEPGVSPLRGSVREREQKLAIEREALSGGPSRGAAARPGAVTAGERTGLNRACRLPPPRSCHAVSHA